MDDADRRAGGPNGRLTGSLQTAGRGTHRRQVFTAKDSLAAVRESGRACLSGYLEGDWNEEPARAEAERRGIAYAHFASGSINRDMEENRATGKVVGLPPEG